MTAYEPQAFWSDRLEQDFNLKGVGHIEYTEGYNRWLYAQKRAALDQALVARPAGTAALDIGSGVGWVVNYLLGRGFRVTGCDIAAGAVERLATVYPAGDFFQLTVGTDPIPREDAEFDVLTMIDVAYHIVDDELWQRALAEFARVLRPSGQVVITDGLLATPLRQAEHVKKRSIGDWERGAAAAGLRVARAGSLFRWLSRPRATGQWGRLPDGPRGAVEFALERLAPVQPHMRWAVLVRV